MKKIIVGVPENYMYYIEKYDYLVGRQAKNISFLLSQHFEDDNSDFCDDPILETMLEEAVQNYIEYNSSISGVTAILLDNDDIIAGDTQLRINRNLDKIYVITGDEQIKGDDEY